MAHSKSEIKKAKNLLNKFAPKGEELAYINSKEATLLKRMGGAGKDVNVSGIKSYYGGGSPADSHNNESTSSSNNNGGGDSDNSPQRQPSSYRSQAPKTAAPRSMLSRIGGAIKSAVTTALTAATFGVSTLAAIGINKTAQYVTKNIGGRMTRTSYNPDNIQNKTAQINMGGGDSGNNNSPARNVSGRIIKLSPTTAEVSQSSATDVTYDSRKTKARGRSMTIRTNSRGVGNNMASVLGKKSLLGAA